MPTTPSGSSRTPNTGSPASLPSQSPTSPARKRKLFEMTPMSTPDEQSNEGAPLKVAPSRTPAASPDSRNRRLMNSTNNMTGLLAMTGVQSDASFGDALADRLHSTGEETEDQEAKRSKTEASSPPYESSNTGYGVPEIDSYTHLLGIGWAKLADDADIQACARGHCRYLVRNYPLTNPEILLKHKSRELNLVKSEEGYFLFKENLQEGRMVHHKLEETLVRLQKINVEFEDSMTLMPEPQKPVGASSESPENDAMELDG